jgi:beta-lactamase class A
MKVLLLLALFLVASMFGCGESVSSNSKSPLTESITTPSSDAELQKQIAEIAKEAKGKVGVYATVIETGQTASFNENEKFAMQSVVKLPISMAVMKQVVDGKRALDQNVKIAKEEFVPSNMRSPIRDANPNGAEMTVEALLRAAISESDGTAADVLQRVAGGAAGVQAYIDSLGIADMQVKHSHKEFGEKWELQYENWATPISAINLLKALWGKKNCADNQKCGELLLISFMTESNNPPNRLKGMLPKGTVVAHKTGSGGTRNGTTSATNDVGIITLPNGHHLAIAVFVGDSTADLATRERVIARIARAVFDKWSQTPTTEPVKPANFNERHTLN